MGQTGDMRRGRKRGLFWLAVLAVCLFLAAGRREAARLFSGWFKEHGTAIAGSAMAEWFPAMEEEAGEAWLPRFFPLFSYLERQDTIASARDPAYERMMAQKGKEKEEGPKEEKPTTGTETAEPVVSEPVGISAVLNQLADYDYLMQKFYSVHPTTTAGRSLMNARHFFEKDLSLKKTEGMPQILIYHTHSQETYADYPKNKNATVIGVGSYLAELLSERGYEVIHDTSSYDYRDGELDRSQAYTYALDGITGILQENPSIQVVLDVHRDGVDEKTRLVAEIDGKPTAKIMLFNGMSQTPEGAIEYLPNPNREANLAFSFQMQLKAEMQYPGLMRKIYLKGLRYNQHVRERAALIEVGAQNNTYEEALNAMEPLAELIDQVLSGA